MNTPFSYGSTPSPFSTMSLDELQRSYQLQMDRLNGIKQQQQMSLPILEEISKAFSSMTSDEQSILMDSHEYKLAKETYEAGFFFFFWSFCLF